MKKEDDKKLADVQEGQVAEESTSQIVLTTQLMASKRMFFFIPVLIHKGLIEAIYSALLIPMLAGTMVGGLSDDEKTSFACKAMIFLGVGEIFGSLGNGYILNWLDSKKFVMLALFETILAHCLFIGFNMHNHYTSAFGMSICFFWGVQDSSAQIFYSSICGGQFENKTTPFSVAVGIIGLTCFACIYLGALVRLQHDFTIYFSLSMCFAIFAWLLFYFGFELRKKELTHSQVELVKQKEAYPKKTAEGA